jgi:hypothetical protein
MVMNIAAAQLPVPVYRVKTVALSEPVVQGTRSGRVHGPDGFIGRVKFHRSAFLIRPTAMVVNHLFFDPNTDAGVIIRQPERERSFEQPTGWWRRD